MQDKDPRFVSLLYDNYADALYGIVLRIVKNESSAQDIMQDSFTKVWQKCATYNREKSKLFTWLLQIFRNTAIDFLRKNQRNSTENIQNNTDAVSKVSSFSTNPDIIDLGDHLNSIEEKYRKVLEALYLKGMTQAETSEFLSIPLGTVKSRLKIGMNNLRKIYGSLIIVFFLLIDLL